MERFLAALPAVADLGERITSLQLRMIGHRLQDTKDYDGRMTLEQGMALRELNKRYEAIKLGDTIIPDPTIPVPPRELGKLVVPSKPKLRDRILGFFN